MVKRIVIDFETYSRRTNVADRIVENAMKQLRRDGCGVKSVNVGICPEPCFDMEEEDV